VSERTSLRSQTWPPAAVIVFASDSQMPMVPCGQKPKVLKALLRGRIQLVVATVS
jgi:hypothetical protein